MNQEIKDLLYLSIRLAIKERQDVMDAIADNDLMLVTRDLEDGLEIKLKPKMTLREIFNK